jgi:hypothetical protein
MVGIRGERDCENENWRKEENATLRRKLGKNFLAKNSGAREMPDTAGFSEEKKRSSVRADKAQRLEKRGSRVECRPDNSSRNLSDSVDFSATTESDVVSLLHCRQSCGQSTKPIGLS